MKTKTGQETSILLPALLRQPAGQLLPKPMLTLPKRILPVMLRQQTLRHQAEQPLGPPPLRVQPGVVPPQAQRLPLPG